MANTSPEACAQALLDCCLAGHPWREDLLEPLLGDESSHLLFRVVAEGLADRFEPRLCDIYAELFAEVIARKIEGIHAPHLFERYRRVRKLRVFEGSAERIRDVFVLSRVTLGADIAVTSVLLDAARRKFPEARISLVGPQKNWELFSASGFEHVPISYHRGGSLSSRFAVFEDLRRALSRRASVIIDPDSRLTQLGLLPVCPEEDYYFFESRAFGGDGDEPIGRLAQRWACHTFAIDLCEAFLDPAVTPEPPAEITVSLGVGENPSKRIADPFESNLIRYLAGRADVLIDQGGGGEEGERVAKAIQGTNARLWTGSFAGFASQIMRSKLYVGYDSAGAHAAAAAGVPLLSIFTGFSSERMFARWRPYSQAPATVLRIDNPDPDTVWSCVEDALSEILQ